MPSLTTVPALPLLREVDAAKVRGHEAALGVGVGEEAAVGRPAGLGPRGAALRGAAAAAPAARASAPVVSLESP